MWVKMHSHSSVTLSNNFTGQLEFCHLEEDPENWKATPIPMQEFFSGSSLKDELPKLTFQKSHWDTRAYHTPTIPGLGSLRQKDLIFVASLCYIVKPCLKKSYKIIKTLDYRLQGVIRKAQWAKVPASKSEFDCLESHNRRRPTQEGCSLVFICMLQNK